MPAWYVRASPASTIRSDVVDFGAIVAGVQPTASIELVDEQGNVEDRLTMVGPGASVSIIADAVHRVRLVVERSDTDIAWLHLNGHGVAIEIKRYGVVSADHRALGEERLQIASEAVIELALLTHLVRIHSYLVVTNSSTDHELLSAVIRPRAEPLAQASTALRGWADGSMDRGIEQVHAQLERLRRIGAIDVNDRRQVGLPADMKAGSRTDL
jgi:hypothetical protein